MHICEIKSSHNPTIVRPHADNSEAGAIVATPAVCCTTARKEKPPRCSRLTDFGMTTVLLNLSNAESFALGSMILAMGIFYVGLAQIIAGIMKWKKSNTFGMPAFLSFAFFWLSLVALLVLPKRGKCAKNF